VVESSNKAGEVGFLVHVRIATQCGPNREKISINNRERTFKTKTASHGGGLDFAICILGI